MKFVTQRVLEGSKVLAVVRSVLKDRSIMATRKECISRQSHGVHKYVWALKETRKLNLFEMKCQRAMARGLTHAWNRIRNEEIRIGEGIEETLKVTPNHRLLKK